ncbi:MAG TPA: hypothetical protein DCL61_32685 [Cyanobacteria bacterium UBA12227]|nr:hypothetical protein [Cyanobacteria bacterium UBA12227]HAX85007.1 hypothetical protein [Cyanobacteria bacterium UBA11370]
MKKVDFLVMEKAWLIQLKGSEFDLKVLSESFCLSDFSVTEDQGSYYLKSQQFNMANEIEEVYRSATELLTFIKGAIEIYSGQSYNISIARVIRVDEQGQRESFVIAPPPMRAASQAKMRARASICRGTEITNSLPQPSIIESYVAIPRQDERAAKVFRIWVSREHNWHNLYHMYEVVEGNVSSMSQIVQNGWATETEIKLFKRTACNENVLGDDARHGYTKDLNLKNPMTLSEAQSLIQKILNHWIRSKCA